jgi:hypothetical protein
MRAVARADHWAFALATRGRIALEPFAPLDARRGARCARRPTA